MAKRTSRTQADDFGTAAPPDMRQDSERDFASNRTDAPRMSGPTEDEIRVRAYERYLERGGTHGMDFDDWLEAERELKQKG